MLPRFRRTCSAWFWYSTCPGVPRIWRRGWRKSVRCEWRKQERASDSSGEVWIAPGISSWCAKEWVKTVLETNQEAPENSAGRQWTCCSGRWRKRLEPALSVCSIPVNTTASARLQTLPTDRNSTSTAGRQDFPRLLDSSPNRFQPILSTTR